MNRTSRNRVLGIALAAGAAAMLSALPTARAGILTFSTTAPTPGASDPFNLTGAPNDGANVNDGGTYSDGATNDGFTYVAGDRSAQGQIFTTGSNAAGYDLSSIWIQEPGYTSNTVSTWWNFTAGGTLTARVVDPSPTAASFVLASDTYTLTGTEANNPAATGTRNSLTGPGDWLQFTFSSPLHLAPDSQYGFDFSLNKTDFFEILGTSSDVYAGGTAYNSGASGVPGTTTTALSGDRVFDVALAPTAVPEPASLSLLALSGLLIAGRRRR